MIHRAVACFVFAILAAMVFAAQPASPQPSPSASPTSSPTPLADDRPLREGLKSMAENSRNLMGWGLTIIGGSILAIISTSYMRPLNRRIRLVYLLFIPGWILVGLSLYYGDSISRRYTAAAFMISRERVSDIGSLMNRDFGSQLTFFNYGLVVFSIWLLIYLVWWVVMDLPQAEKQSWPFPKRRRRRRLL
jgi:hypothetical protein